MAPAALHRFAFFLLFLHLTSGSGIDKMMLSSKPIKQSRKFDIQENRTPFLYSDDAITVRDTPTTYFTPTDTTPVVNPSPPTTTTSPTTTTPTITPTMPTTPTTTTPTTPFTTPTTPFTTPTTPTTPATPVTSPTTPTTTPTTTPMSPDTQTSSGGGSWCMASSSASETALQVALDYACGYGGADCSALQTGGSCYNPNTVKDHASYAFNQYYQKNPGPTSCSFGGTAQLTTTDPSSGSCHFASSQSNTSTTSPPTPFAPTTTTPGTPLIQSPPSPSIMTTPIGGSTVYGAEPVGSPNMAASMVQNSLLILGTTIMLMHYLFGDH